MSTRLTAFLFCFMLSLPGWAEDQPAGAEGGSWYVGLALGAGQRSNPLINGDDIDLWWSLDVAWFGERWFFDNGDLGFTLQDKPAYSLNWVARVNTERAFFSELNEGLFNGVGEFLGAEGLEPTGEQDGGRTDDELLPVEIPDRDYALESGLEILSDGAWGRLQGQLLFDVSGVHQGIDAWLSYSRDWIVGRWHLAPSISLNWKSRDLNDYYYGISAEEAQAGLPQYQAGAGTNVRARLSASYFVSEHWRVLLSADYERFSNSVADSPLMKDDHIVSYFVGAHYAF